MIAVRPPEYWPRLSYLALAASADRFVFADTFQYSRQSFQNRARLRTPQGWQWISVPLQGGQHGRRLEEVVVAHREPWLRKHWRSLEYNYRSTPFFEFYEPDLAPLFRQHWDTLADLTCTTAVRLFRLYGLETAFDRASALEGSPVTLPGVLAAAEQERLLVPEKAASHDARQVGPVVPFRYDPPAYRQNFEGFEPDLSALDLLFNYGPEAKAVLMKGVRNTESS